MKNVVVLFGFLLLSVSQLKAGSINFIGDAAAVHGKLSLTSAGIHVEGSTAPDVNLAGVLEADFADDKFHLDYFSSNGTTINELPKDWQGGDVGKVDPSGAYTYADGTLTITGNGRSLSGVKDRGYYLSRPWSGDGQWIMHVQFINKGDPALSPGPEASLLLRHTAAPDAAMFGVGVGPVIGDGTMANGLQHHRNNDGEGAQWNAINISEPFWIRVSRNSKCFDIALSSDGGKWQVVEQDFMQDFPVKIPPAATTPAPAASAAPTASAAPVMSYRAGIFLTSQVEDLIGKAVIDQILFTPSPAEPETLPAGALLVDGTFLAGGFGQLDPKTGSFNRADKAISISPGQVAADIYNTVTMHQLADVASQTGLIMKNGDFMQSDLVSGAGMVQVTSATLGPQNFYGDAIRAYVLNPVKPMPSNYEVRLKDGSSIRASGIVVDANGVTITDVSGIAVVADPDEVAQVRAGPALVQNLIGLPWKASPETFPLPPISAAAKAATAANAPPPPPPAPPTPPPAPPPAAPATSSPPATTNDATATNAPDATTATNSAPTTNAAPAANPPAAAPAAVAPAPAGPPPQVTDEPSVRCWQGSNQEQIMALIPGTSIDFPLTGKFRALALKVALLPDAPAGSEATVRILADGKEVGSTTPIHAGDQPRFFQVTLDNPKSVTIEANSAVARTKVLVIDPVAVRK